MAMVFIRTCRNFEWAWNCIRVPSVSGRRPRGTCSKALGPANHGCRKHSAALGRAASPVASMRRQRESALVEACRKSRQSGSTAACTSSRRGSLGSKGEEAVSSRNMRQPQDQTSHLGPKSRLQTSGARNSGWLQQGTDSRDTAESCNATGWQPSCREPSSLGKSKRTCKPKPGTTTCGWLRCRLLPLHSPAASSTAETRTLAGRRSRCITGPSGCEWQYATASSTCRNTSETQASVRPFDCT
mmetsp:Transcript_10752/g.33526  ORF Transcript_10752/g.33526 Transcript_10752/m.33526 type:complete len:243 (-) Transcript_10752:1739-2467(-)